MSAHLSHNLPNIVTTAGKPVPVDQLTCINKHVEEQVTSFSASYFFLFDFLLKIGEGYMLWQ